MTSRRSISPMRRLAIFERAGGRCHICGQKIQVGERWDVEHPIPIALGGADDDTNMAPAHSQCHAPKTADDVASISRAKRRKAKHVGIKKVSSFHRPAGFRFDWSQGRYVKEENTP